MYGQLPVIKCQINYLSRYTQIPFSWMKILMRHVQQNIPGLLEKCHWCALTSHSGLQIGVFFSSYLHKNRTAIETTICDWNLTDIPHPCQLQGCLSETVAYLIILMFNLTNYNVPWRIKSKKSSQMLLIKHLGEHTVDWECHRIKKAHILQDWFKGRLWPDERL